MLKTALMDMQYHNTIETDSPVLQAAYAMAKEGHRNQSRGKKDATIPYLVHPVMLYHLLKDLGEADELTLAAALLHDVKEDGERYREVLQALPKLINTISGCHVASVATLDKAKGHLHHIQNKATDYVTSSTLFRDDLSKQLQFFGVNEDNATSIAHLVDERCGDLTNPIVMLGSKRLFQRDHAGKLPLHTAKIKLLDQTASLLDFILSPNNEEFSNEKVAKWNFKALDLVKAIASYHPELKPWRDLHKALFSYAMEIVNADSPEEEATLRQNFSWKMAVETADRMKEAKDVEAVSSVKRNNITELKKGIVSVSFSEFGEVVGYHCLSKPDMDEENSCNQVFDALIHGIESSKTTRRSTTSEAMLNDGNRIVRFVKVKPPMELQQFSGLAKEYDAIDHAYSLQLQREAPQQEMQTELRHAS
jgi:hypothetical protein